MEKIRLLLIEDNRLLLDSLTAMLQGQADLEIVASLEKVGDALLKARELKPHVVLLDMSLGDENSLSAAEALRKEAPGAKVIVMDLIPSHEDVLQFVRVGASGFILKDATLSDFIKTIRSVARGENVLPPLLTESLFCQIAQHAGRIGKVQLSESVRVTKRERQVIELIAEGLSDNEMAERLHVTVYTVKSHMHKILEKLALRTRLEIASYTRGRKNPKV